MECERAKYGFMDRGQMLEFLRNVARSLNRNGIGGGPYGILRKASGNQCSGYSCDIICAGRERRSVSTTCSATSKARRVRAGARPHTWPNIRVDVCEIQ